MRVLINSLCALVALVLLGCQSSRAPATPALYDEVKPIKLEIPPVTPTVESRRVLLVCNIASNDSIKLTEYYARKRQIPPENIVQIDVPAMEEITMDRYQDDIERLVRRAIENNKNRIDYIVLTRGVPFRVDDGWGYSVDSLLVGMDRDFELHRPDMAPDPEAMVRHANPYFDREEPFSSERYGIYLVTRLDGYSLEDAKRMVERSIKATAEKGPFLFDLAPNRFDNPEGRESSGWHSAKMQATEQQLRENGFTTIIEDQDKVQRRREDLSYEDEFLAPRERLMGYVSWGSNDASFDLEKYRQLQFLSGAIAETYVSTSARTMIQSDEGQSLVGDLIQQGVTGVKGYVSEPWTIALCRVDILFDRYSRGYNLAESFYASSQLIRWKDVVFGDPLCRPYGEFVDGERPKRVKP